LTSVPVGDGSRAATDVYRIGVRPLINAPGRSKNCTSKPCTAAPANGVTPYAISFATVLAPGFHNFSLRGQTYAGATPGVFGQTSAGLLTVVVVKQ
jgi:hypothetical protein